jgi:hypothetical protein
MPKKNSNLRINLDLLKPQSEPQRIAIKAFKWLLSSGRFLIIFVEIIVLAAFLVRFKFDADIASTKEAIDQQVPFIESLASDEKLIRQTQFQLSTMKEFRASSLDYVEILKKIAKQTPSGVTIKSLSLEKQVAELGFRMVGTSIDNNQLSSFVAGLKSDGSFTNLNLADIAFEGGLINFTLTGGISSSKEKI